MKGGYVLNQGEFYNSNEYNTMSEYKHFPAEIYIKPAEENECGKEGADLGREITSLQTGRKSARGANGAKTLIDRIFGSIRGVATAATVAAASIAVSATFVTSAPQVELTELTCADTYVEYEMVLGNLDEDGEYAIVVSTSNEEDKESAIEGNGTYKSRVEGLKPEWEYTISVVRYDSVLGRVSHFVTKFQTLKSTEQQLMPPPDPVPDPNPIPPPSVQITDIDITGINKIQISFTHKDLPEDAEIALDLAYGSVSTRITLGDSDVARGYVVADMDTSDTVKVTPAVIATSAGEEIVTRCEEYTHTFAETLSVQTMVGLYDSVVTFYPMGITNGAEYLHITSSAAPDSPEIAVLEGVVEVWYSTAEPITYTMYLTNENGDVLSSEAVVTVDTSVEITAPSYNSAFPNPSDVTVTYNDDGTVNIYIRTQFETESEELYYQVTLGDIVYTSQESIARLENIPDESYSLKYDVCMDVNGVRYSIFRIVPSGMVNEPYFIFQSDLYENVLHLQIYKDEMHVDLNTVVLITSNKDRIQLSESDFVYSEEYEAYCTDVQIDPTVTSVVMQLMANPYCDDIDAIESYLGNERKLIEETVYEA